MAVKSIILDLGNVLMFHDNARLARAFAARTGAVPDALLQQLQGHIWPRTDTGELRPSELRQELCEWFGVELSEEEFGELWTSHFSPNAQMIEQVESLVGRVKLLLLSNTNELHAAYVRAQVPLLKRFDHLLFSHELGCVKPDPRIFEIALEKSGTAPHDTAYFDDVAAYVEGARELGIRSHLFESAAAFPAQLRDLGLAH